MTLDKRVNRLSRDKRRASQLDLLELAVAKEFVDSGFAQAQSLCDLVNLIGHALQVRSSLYVVTIVRGQTHTPATADVRAK